MSSRKSALEQRVDRVRKALNSQLLDTQGSSAPLISDDSVAVIVAAEARRSRELAMKLGPRAYLVSFDFTLVSLFMAHGSEFSLLAFLALQLEHDPTNGGANGGGGYRRVSETNKTFLQNTIRSVESHNRREVCVLYCAREACFVGGLS